MDFRQLVEGHHGEKIRGDQKRIHASIVGRPKGRVNHADGPRGITKPCERRSIDRIVRRSLKCVWAWTIQSLLFVKSLYDQPARLLPFSMKTSRIAGGLPVSMGQTHWVTERIYFPLAFAKLRTQRRFVTDAPRASFSAETERVRIPVNQDA